MVAGARRKSKRTSDPAAAVEVAEPRVAVAAGVPLQVFEVEQFQGDAGLAALSVDPGAVGRGTLPLTSHVRPAVELTLELVVGQRLDLSPVQAGGAGAREHAGDRAQLRATARWLSPRAHFWRRIPRVCRMDSRSAAIAPLSSGGGRRAGPSSVAR
jgi:hypothetical protein